MPVINKPIQYFAANTWNGSGAATVTVDFGFQPDLVWIKPRNNVASNANSHILIDSVRGSDKVLRSQTTGAEVTESNNITAFTSTGITIGDSHNVNKNTTSQYVAWAWKKGATQGFDIVTYTGNGSGAARSVAHNLGVAPRLMITKGREAQVTGTDNWLAWHGTFGAGEYLVLNSNAAKATSSSYWGNTVPNSSNFFVGGGASNVHNENGKNYIAYLFAEVAGFSKFGSYTGNGSADGPFVFCGFRPRFVLYKRTDTVGNWQIFDSARSTYNVHNGDLIANSSAAEAPGAGQELDVLSNGFKPRTSNADRNASGGTYIFMAMAENPFKYALAR